VQNLVIRYNIRKQSDGKFAREEKETNITLKSKINVLWGIWYLCKI
jgi:hypothetical protein